MASTAGPGAAAEAAGAGEPGRASPETLERENRILERRLQRMEANVRRMEAMQDSNATLLTRLLNDLDEERARSQALLRNVLPQRIIDRLAAGETRIADRHDDAVVLFSDFVGFTGISAEVPAAALVADLDALFRAFDHVCAEAGVEKIKTVGDAYLAVAGLDGASPLDAARAAAEAALQMLAEVAERPPAPVHWRIRIGVNAGPLVAGVVGSSKFAYDVWGDTVNVASRLETSSEPDRIHVSAGLAERLDGRYVLERRGFVELKGKGAVETFYLVGRR
jgi:adenylate cyclase